MATGPSSASALSVAHYAAERRCLHVCLSCVARAASGPVLASGDPLPALVEEVVCVCTRLNSRVRAAGARRSGPLLACALCESVLVDAVTVACGHTFCRQCVGRHRERPCVECGALCLDRPYQPSVVVNKCLRLGHPREAEKRHLREAGNGAMAAGDFPAAVRRYSEALDIDRRDHFLLGNRAKAFLSARNPRAALDDSTTATALRPFWTKGFYRKAAALLEMGRHGEAALNFFVCLCISPTVSEAREGLLACLRQALGPGPGFIGGLVARADGYCALFAADRLSLLREMATCDLAAWFAGLAGGRLRARRKRRESGGARGADGPAKKSRERAPAPNPAPAAAGADDTAVNYWAGLAPGAAPQYERIFVIEDFECCLCFRLLYRPVTTPCGHSFCRQCLDRCLDYNPECPLCKQTLAAFLEERRDGLAEILIRLMDRCWPEEVAQRRQVYEEEMSKVARAGSDVHHELPIFVCTLAFPGVPCQLHIFEPRYRLMVRRCAEVSDPKFGMTVGVDGPPGFVDVGTILRIREVQYLPDGRSLVDTVGGRRFRVLRRGMQDGYNTATIELIDDAPVPEERRESVRHTCRQFYHRLSAWYRSLNAPLLAQFASNYGPLPVPEPDVLGGDGDGPAWLWWLVAVLPQDAARRLELIASTDLEARLTAMMALFAHLVPPA